MTKFVKKTAFFLLPVLLFLMALEFSIRQIPNDYTLKRDYLNSNSNNIEVIFLGSSHTYYGVNPEYISNNAFNASHTSQTIDYDYEIIKKYNGNWNQLKTIVLPIDYFTLFAKVSTGIESWRVKNYEIYYDIKRSKKLQDQSEILSLTFDKSFERIKKYYLHNKSAISCTPLGFANKSLGSKDIEKDGPIAAKRHTISDQKHYKENIMQIQKFIEFASQNNIRLLFYTSPAYSSYRESFDQHQFNRTIHAIDSIVKGNSIVSYSNFLSDSSFHKSDFMDSDHLNPQGAKKLSLKLNEILNAN